MSLRFGVCCVTLNPHTTIFGGPNSFSSIKVSILCLSSVWQITCVVSIALKYVPSRMLMLNLSTN